MARTLITNGTVIGPTGRVANDVLVDGETIAALYAPGQAAAQGVTAERTIDAAGRYVIPGGVDVHTHLEMDQKGTISSDTFTTGTTAAAWGGVTTIVDFATQLAGQRVPDTLADRHEQAAGACAVDYAFHQVIGGVDDESLKAMASLVEHEGITSFKVFMAYPGSLYSDDGQILRTMQVAREHGATVMVHAENGIAIDVLVAQALERGETGPRHHGLTRPSVLEGEATQRAIALAEVADDVPLYIVHLSASEALAAVAAARHRGRNVFAETCPQYLWLTMEETLDRPGFDGARWVCSPPIRPGTGRHHHQADLWRGLRTDELAVVSTDHCPFCFADQKTLGRDDFSLIPNGLATIEHRMELLYQGVVTGQLTLERWVETCCTTPARLFGLYPRKGIVAPGSDADLVVWDPAGTTHIGIDDKHHMAVDHSSWEGFTVDGKVDVVLSRGEILVEGDRFLGRAGHGRYLARDRNQLLR